VADRHGGGLRRAFFTPPARSAVAQLALGASLGAVSLGLLIAAFWLSTWAGADADPLRAATPRVEVQFRPAADQNAPLSATDVVGGDRSSGGAQAASRRPRAGEIARVALVLRGNGIDSVRPLEAHGLPRQIAFVFSPSVDDANGWVRQARQHGHELLLGVPMEPRNDPTDDPGPRALLSSLPAEENLARLRWLLEQTWGYIGVASVTGTLFLDAPDALAPVFDRLERRELMFFQAYPGDTAAAAVAADRELPYVAADVVLDEEPSREAIRARLADLVALAEEKGRAIGFGHAYPITLEAIGDWLATASENRIELVSLSGLVKPPWGAVDE
jgi:uncharacterized protein